MAGNPFFSGRIPQGLHDRIQEHCDATGETKTQVLIQALAAYLDHPLEVEQSGDEEIKMLNDRIEDLEKRLNEWTGLIAQSFEKIPPELRRLDNKINQLAIVITTDNSEIKADTDLKVICIERICPSCQSDDMSAIPYESDDEVLFECLSCGWQNTFKLSIAKEWGYIPYENDDNSDDNEELSPLTQSKLARRLGVNKSQISRRKSQPRFEEWNQGLDPDAIAWKYDDEKKLFVPQRFGG